MEKKLIIDALALEKGKNYGYQEFLFNILTYFNANRDDLLFDDVIVLVKDTQTQHLRHFSNLTVEGVHFPNLFVRLFLQDRISNRYKLKSSDVILSTYNYCSLTRQKAKEVLIVHDLLFKRAHIFKNKLMLLQRTLYLPISLRRADKIIAISKATKDDILSYYNVDETKIEIIRNVFSFEKFVKKGNKEVGNYFLSICSSQPHKNTLTLLRAFECYCKEGGKLNLVLVGAIKGNQSLESLYDLMDENIKSRIHLVRNISNEELSNYYENAAAFISASLFEGLGMPVVEAMYFNLPLLLSDISIFHEVSGEQAKFFSSENVSELCQLMLHYQSHRIDYTRHLNSYFSEDATSRKYVSILNAL